VNFCAKESKIVGRGYIARWNK